MTRAAYSLTFGEGLEEEEKEKAWLAEEPIEAEDPEITEEEKKKKEDEAAAKATTETEEANSLARRVGTKMFIYGSNFLNQEIWARFRVE